MTEPMDLCTTPLDGTTLIEASAGTGKTYTLTGLFVRLLLEKGLTVDQILVVTFTDAATEELRGRIRKRLADMAGVLADELKADDDLERELMARFQGTDAARRLELALRNFDLAQIFTIHGFCQRMLTRNGFECQALFDTQLEPDLSELRRQVCLDFWRSRILPLPGLTGTEVRACLNPDHLAELSDLPFLAQDIRIEPGDVPPDPAPRDHAVQDACARIKAAWPSAQREARELLLGRAGNFNARMFTPDKLRQRLEAVRTFIHTPRLDARDQLKAMAELTPDYVRGMTKKAFEPPEHPLFAEIAGLLELVEALRRAVAPFVTHLRHAFLSGFTARLDALKRERSVMGFDDLLRGMHAALASPELVAAARSQYRAALIDEFQDTDSLQYDIFRTLFAAPEAENCLFLIGDPKQAIYSFRGADLHTYLQAAEDCERSRTLGVNYRSTPELIEAVNRVFSRQSNPFLHRRIAFQPVSAPDGALGGGHERFTEDGTAPAPLVLWHAVSEEKPLAKGALAPRICRAVAAETSRLLNGSRQGRVRIGDKPLLPGHIAVLVETHAQGADIHRALAELGIPGVVTHTSSVFATPEARELLSVLEGMAECRRPQALRTALAMPLTGLSAKVIFELEGDGKLDAAFERFLGYRDLWERRGVMAALQRLLADLGVRERLVSLPGGERRMTNVLHCMELLHARERETGAAMHALLTWFGRRLDADATEDTQLRLDTDRDAVQIVTIHKSKGLQYPVVFCPFIFGRARCPEDRALVHDGGLLLDLGSPELPTRKDTALKEAQAERVRLLYVALTRAECRCYAVWGRINEAETSGAAWLFHGHRAAESGALSWDEVDEGMVAADLRALGDGTVEVAELPGIEPEAGPPQFTHAPDLQCRNWDRMLGPGYGLASFTGLTRGMEHGRPGLDEDDAAGQAEDDEWSMARFPRGAAAGSCLHRIFERIDFTDPATVPGEVTDALAAYGFDAAWERTVTDMVLRTLRTDMGGFRLEQIGPKDRLTELEFLFPLRPVTREGLAAVYREAAALLPATLPERMESLRFEPRRGFMTGFMDLVVRHEKKFYLLDWKSNWLGPTPAHYTREAVDAAMAGSHYFLQYHLYCLALKRHLALRMPKFDCAEHSGGVRYVFLRGVDPQRPGQGVHINCPDTRFIDALDKALIDMENR